MTNETSDWLEIEQRQVSSGSFSGERLPSVQFVENQIKELHIDATKPWNKWVDPKTGKTKAIIPCLVDVDGKLVQQNFWLNVRNPLYSELIRICRVAPDRNAVKVRVLQTGSLQNTKYILVK